jgi:lantibiotic modifying enzyme
VNIGCTQEIPWIAPRCRRNTLSCRCCFADIEITWVRALSMRERVRLYNRAHTTVDARWRPGSSVGSGPTSRFRENGDSTAVSLAGASSYDELIRALQWTETAKGGMQMPSWVRDVRTLSTSCARSIKDRMPSDHTRDRCVDLIATTYMRRLAAYRCAQSAKNLFISGIAWATYLQDESESLRNCVSLDCLSDPTPLRLRFVVATTRKKLASTVLFLRALSRDYAVLTRHFLTPGIRVQAVKRTSWVETVITEGGARLIRQRRPEGRNQINELVRWLNKRSRSPHLTIPSVLERRAYCWFVLGPDVPLNSRGQVRSFFAKVGIYLAAVSLLRARPLLEQDILRVGDDLVVNCPDFGYLPSLFVADCSATTTLGSDTLIPSGTGPWPWALWCETVNEWGLPSVCSASDWSGEIVSGFAAAGKVFLRRRKRVLRMLKSLRSSNNTILVRERWRYDLITSVALARNFEDNGLTDFGLTLLSILSGGAAMRWPLALRIAEAQSLAEFRTPEFSARVGQRVLYAGCKQHALPVARSVASALEVMLTGVRQMNAQTVRATAEYVGQSFKVSGARILHHPLLHPIQHVPEPADARVLSEATRAGDYLLSIALDTRNGPVWMNITRPTASVPPMSVAGLDLYSGSPGIVLFLKYLSRVTGLVKFGRFADRAIREWDRSLVRYTTGGHYLGLGAFGELGGLAYALSHLCAMEDNSYAHRLALRVIELIEARLDSDRHFDLLAGRAGCIMALLSLCSVCPSRHLLDICGRLGHRLCAEGKPAGGGLAWTGPRGVLAPLTGMGHGTSGIALALWNLFVVTGDESCRSTALGALAYEAGAYSPDAANWPDYRALEVDPEGLRVNRTPTYPVLWCHGASGIGMARLGLLMAGCNEPGLRQDAMRAYTATIGKGFGRNHSLCHGDSGNIDLLLECAAILGDPRAVTAARGQTGAMMERIRRYGWLCGTNRWARTPGLMQGIAGIGYQLLRIAAPHRVPSILRLARPLGSKIAISEPDSLPGRIRHSS